MKYFNLFLVILCLKFSINFWCMLSEVEKKNILLSTACEFAQKSKGKAKAFIVVNPQDWSVEIHAEMVEIGL